MTFNRIRLGILSLALITFTALAVPLISHAQSTTQGAIAGSVLDTSGAVIPGATITIVNTANNFTQKLTSDGSGFFKAPLLEPGTYTVTIASANFAQYRADNVVVVVGQVTTIEPRLAVASSSTQVVVTEQAPVMNLESPDFSDTINLRAMNNIPINIRRWSALAMSTPGVVADSSGFGLVSVRGISTLLNNVEIDGADDNQAYFSEERGRTREAYSTTGSAVREFAVNTGVYSAEYGRAAGGVITSVTKSGTNQLHGQAYFWDRESNWAASNEFSTITSLNPTTGANVVSPFKAEDLRKIYGFTVGGPIIKNKLFWIYTYDQHTRVFPVVGVPDSPSAFYATPPATDTACNTTTGYTTSTTTLDQDVCALAARQKISYATAATDYNTAINDLSSDIGEVARFGYQEINTPKIDWQVNDKNHLSVLFHRLRWDSPGGVQTSSTDHYARDTQGNDFVKLDYGLTKLTSLITSNISNEVLYQYSRELDDETQQTLTPYSTSYLEGTNGVVAAGGMSPNVPEVAESTSTSGFYIGSPYYSYRLQYPIEYKWQIGDIVYWNKGNHSIRLGVDLVHNFDQINNTYEANGYFSYTTPSDYVNDWLNKANGVNAATSGTGCNSSATATASSTGGVTGTDPCYVDFYQGYGNPIYSISTLDSGYFAQDNWKFSPRLTLELGLRWDKEMIPGPSSNLTTATGAFVPYSQLNNNPSDNMEFGPRVGFAWDIFGKGETVLRGGYGLYYGRMINAMLLNARLNTGSPNGQYSVTYNKSNIGPQLPNIEPTTGGTPPSPASYYLASNLKSPEVHEFDIALQQSAGKGTIFQLSYLGALGRLLPNYLDYNLQPLSLQTVDITISDPNNAGPIPNGTVYKVPTYTVAAVNPTTGAVGANYGNSSGFGNTALFGAQATNFQSITAVVSNINSSYNAVVAEIQNRSLHSVQFDANYTWSHALDFSQNASTAAGAEGWYDPFGNARVNYANSTWDVPNRFVAYVTYDVPNVPTTTPLKWVSNNWSLSSNFSMQNGLPFTLGTSTGYNSDDAAGEGWNGSGGALYIPSIGINTYRYPKRWVDDLRVQKEFPFEHGYNLQLIANAFNVFNHQNVDGMNTTGYLYSDTGSSGLTTGASPYPKDLASTLAYQPTFHQITSKNNTGFLLTPRELEIAAKFVF